MVNVVIGAASGMGEAVARRLAGPGRRLVVADLDVVGVERLAAELDGEVEAHRCDITVADDLAALADAVGDSLGALVVTAGLSPTMAGGRRIYDVDLIGPALLLKVMEPIATKGSVALLFASMAGHLAPADAAVDAVLARPLDPGFFDDMIAAGVDVEQSDLAYMYAKRGLMRLVRAHASAWGGRGARLLSLSPGVIDTPMGRQEDARQPSMAALVEGSPIGRVIDADEVAAVAAFLVSDAAGAITGTDVLVDGGATSLFV